MFIKSRQVLFGLLAISLGALAINSKKIYCGLRGHEDLMEFGKDRLYLYCQSCGWSSPGWEIGKKKNQVIKESNVQP